MGKILQKKKNRSGLAKARPKNNRRKSGDRKINMLGNAIIAENWYGFSPQLRSHSVGCEARTNTITTGTRTSL